MNLEKYYLLGLIFSVGFFLGTLVGLIKWKGYLVERVGVIGYIFIFIIFGGLVGPPLLWCLSLLPSKSELYNPFITGIGGPPYGLEYDLYPQVVSYCFFHFMVFMCAVLVFFRKPRFPGGGNQLKLIHYKFQKSFQNKQAIEWLFMTGAILFFVVYFEYSGWSRLMESNVERWEVASDGHLAFLGPFMKLIPTLGLFAGLMGAILVTLVRRWWVATISTLIVTIPFIVMASRAYTLILAMLYFGLVFRCNRLFRRILMTLSPLAIAFLLLVPLQQRNYSYTGLNAFGAASENVLEGALDGRSIMFSLQQIAANSSQGFPVLVETVSQAKSGPMLADVPMGYIWRSFSPTISWMDNFSNDWLQYTIMLNPFTPINTLGELYGIHPLFSFCFVTLIYIILLAMVCHLQKYGGIGMLFSIFIAGMAIFSMARLQQYPIRTTMRVIYTAVLVGASGGIGLSIFYCKESWAEIEIGSVRKRISGNPKKYI